ncbi:hypothetical protein CHUAL_010594 [Chamberlinius hualienensis]
MAMKIQEKTVDKGDDVTFVGGVPRLKTKIDTRKSDLLEYMKFYQSCFRARKVEKEIKAIQDEKETELCLLLEYVNKQSDEIENLKQQIFDLTKSNIQQNAKSQNAHVITRAHDLQWQKIVNSVAYHSVSRRGNCSTRAPSKKAKNNFYNVDIYSRQH